MSDIEELRKERDAAVDELQHVIEGLAESAKKRLAAEAQVERLKATLTHIMYEWDKKPQTPGYGLRMYNAAELALKEMP